jgi:hypothetical protein
VAGKERPNFYILLGLDPVAEWDETLYRRQLAELRATWTKEANGLPSRSKTIEAKQNLSFFKYLSLMEDPTKREAERQLALKLRRDEILVRKDELTDRLRLLTAKGYLLPSEKEDLETRYADVLAAEPGLHRQLRETRVHEGADRPAELDDNLGDTIRGNLRSAGERTLYDVLKVANPAITFTSPLEDLQQAANSLALKAHRTKDKNNPKITAWDRLATSALTLFASEEGQSRYDLFMKREKIRVVIVEFQKALSVATAFSAQQVELYLEQVRVAGVSDLGMAIEQLLRHFRGLGWVVELPDHEAETRIHPHRGLPPLR